MPFEGAADIELRVDDGPVVVELDAFELGKTAPAARGLGVLDVVEIERRSLAVMSGSSWGMGTSGWSGKKLGDQLAKRCVEGRAAAGGVGEQRSAARLEVPAQRLDVVVVEAGGPPGRECKPAGSRSGWDRARTGLSG